MQILVGADPELFVLNPNSQMFISGHNLIQGTKEDPSPVNKGAVQVDGLALEFNIDPAKSANEFIDNCNTVRKQLQALVPGLQLVAVPFAEFEPEYFNNLPEESKVLGCTPDFCGWTKDVNEAPDGNFNFRTASGHIHIGWTEDAGCFSDEHYTTCCNLVKQLDYYVGIFSLLFDPDGRRRAMYGKAGAFRPKTYGVEYRVLSNTWLNSDLLGRWVYHAIVKGTQDFFDPNVENFEAKYGDLARDIIDGNLVDWVHLYPGLLADLNTRVPSPPHTAKQRKVA